MKNIKNYETHIAVYKHVNIQKKNGILIFTGPLGVTLINLALHDKLGNSQLSLYVKSASHNSEKKSMMIFKSCNKTFFKCMLNTIKDKMHIVCNGFLVYMHVSGVGYRVEIQNNSNVACGKKKNDICSIQAPSTEPATDEITSPGNLLNTLKHTMLTQEKKKNISSFNAYTNKDSFIEKYIYTLSLSEKQTQTLFFKIGFSHDFKYICPSSVRMFTQQQTLVCIYGIDRNQVSTIAAKIRMIKKPSVYKGNSITFVDEKITYKQGKRK